MLLGFSTTKDHEVRSSPPDGRWLYYYIVV